MNLIVKAVIVNNFEYRYLDEPKKKDKSQERWLCMWTEGKKKCSSSLTIDSKTKKITKVNGKPWDKETPLTSFHDHPALTDSEVKLRFVKHELTEKAETSSGAIPKMFEDKSDELASRGHSIEEIAQILPQYNSAKSAMYRAHAKYFPPIPTALEDLSFNGPLYEQYILTKKYKKRFLLFDGYQEIRDKKNILTGYERITIYCSDYGLKPR